MVKNKYYTDFSKLQKIIITRYPSSAFQIIPIKLIFYKNFINIFFFFYYTISHLKCPLFLIFVRFYVCDKITKLYEITFQFFLSFSTLKGGVLHEKWCKNGFFRIVLYFLAWMVFLERLVFLPPT